jgi:hypothetical protein
MKASSTALVSRSTRIAMPNDPAWLFPHPAFRKHASNHFIGRRVFTRHRQKPERLIQRSARPVGTAGLLIHANEIGQILGELRLSAAFDSIPATTRGSNQLGFELIRQVNRAHLNTSTNSVWMSLSSR